MLNTDDYADLNEALRGRTLQAFWWTTEIFSADYNCRMEIF